MSVTRESKNPLPFQACREEEELLARAHVEPREDGRLPCSANQSCAVVLCSADECRMQCR